MFLTPQSVMIYLTVHDIIIDRILAARGKTRSSTVSTMATKVVEVGEVGEDLALQAEKTHSSYLTAPTTHTRRKRSKLTLMRVM